MAKTNTVFVCSNCGNESPKWFGKCTSCNEWNTCYEEKITTKASTRVNNKKVVAPVMLKDVKQQTNSRMKTGYQELDRVLRWRTGKGVFNFATVENQELENLR